MDDQALGVPDVGEVREKLDAVDELLAGLEPPLDAEADDGARPFRKVLLRAACDRDVAGKPRVVDPGDQRVLVQPLRDLLGVLAWRSIRTCSVSSPGGSGRS